MFQDKIKNVKNEIKAFKKEIKSLTKHFAKKPTNTSVSADISNSVGDLNYYMGRLDALIEAQNTYETAQNKLQEESIASMD